MRIWRSEPGARAVALASIALLLVSGCGKDDQDDDDDLDRERSALLQEELDELREIGLEYQLPPPLPPEEIELHALKLKRRQVAAQIASEVDQAMAPLVAAAALFAPSGPVDLLLTVMPVHKLGKAVKVARDGIKLRKKSKRARKLIELHKQLIAELDVDGRQFLRLASVLPEKHLQALTRIHAHTGSSSVIRVLMRKHLRHDADLRWIADKLGAGKLAPTTVRRYTFDADFVAEFTEYNANPSWRVLQDVVQGKAVPDGVRDSLAAKVAGLLGERAVVRHPVLRRARPPEAGARDRIPGRQHGHPGPG